MRRYSGWSSQKIANARSRPSRFLCGRSVETASRNGSGRRQAARLKKGGSTPEGTVRIRSAGKRYQHLRSSAVASDTATIRRETVILQNRKKFQNGRSNQRKYSG